MLECDVHADFAALGELDRVASRLSSTWRTRLGSPITCGGTSLATSQIQFEVLLVRAQRQGLHRFADYPRQVERNMLDQQLAGLDLREVENVVDDRQQRLATRIYDPEILPLLFGQRGIERAGRSSR